MGVPGRKPLKWLWREYLTLKKVTIVVTSGDIDGKQASYTRTTFGCGRIREIKARRAHLLFALFNLGVTCVAPGSRDHRAYPHIRLGTTSPVLRWFSRIRSNYKNLI